MPFELISSIKIAKEELVNSKIFTNDTAFNDGWRAYVVPDNGFISRKLPFINGEKLDNHFKVNNWANGWDVSSLNEPQSDRIVTIFLPQYLQYLGIILTGLPISIFMTFLISKKLPTIKNFFRKINSYFEKKAEFFKLKIAESKHLTYKKTFPYSINLAEKGVAKNF